MRLLSRRPFSRAAASLCLSRAHSICCPLPFAVSRCSTHGRFIFVAVSKKRKEEERENTYKKENGGKMSKRP